MPTARDGYYVEGKRVPSVTTILGRFKESGGLIHWAWQLGKDGKDYRQERDKAANVGTLIHDAVDSWVTGKPFNFRAAAPHMSDELLEKAKRGFDSFLHWSTLSRLEVTHSEVELVSRRHLFGGTADGFTLGGKRAVVDWKSSNSIYPEYLIQVRAYGALWDENFPQDKIEGGYHLLRFDKEFGDFHHHFWPELDSAWEAFKHMRETYEILKELTKRAA